MDNISITSRICALCAFVLIAASLNGCYLVESGQGQLSLMSKRRPIARVVADPRTPGDVRKQLEAVAQIREFAIRNLHLPDNGSYRTYADVGRPYVVWNVVAAPEFSVDPKEWCYPIVGCVAYRGYFVERRARAFGESLRAKGFDVSVGGVAAYSTLGHFDDPILNTMIGWNDVEYEALGQDFTTRGARQEEQIQLLRQLFTEPVVDFTGRFDRVDRAALVPKPQRPIPIWLGGSSEAAFDRAARLADGFLFFGGGLEHAVDAWGGMQTRLDVLGRPVEAFGREYVVLPRGGLDDLAAEVDGWRSAGGTHLSVITMGLGLTSTDSHIDYLASVAATLNLR